MHAAKKAVFQPPTKASLSGVDLDQGNFSRFRYSYR